MNRERGTGERLSLPGDRPRGSAEGNRNFLQQNPTFFFFSLTPFNQIGYKCRSAWTGQTN